MTARPLVNVTYTGDRVRLEVRDGRAGEVTVSFEKTTALQVGAGLIRVATALGAKPETPTRPEPTRAIGFHREDRAIGDLVIDRDGRRWTELPRPTMGRSVLVRDHLGQGLSGRWSDWYEAELPVAGAAMLVAEK